MSLTRHVKPTTRSRPWKVVDLFSGAGGMSYGFHAHPAFEVVGGVDAQLAKPSSPRGSLECNLTYKANIGIEPLEFDLGKVTPSEVRKALGDAIEPEGITVLSSCAPCTGYTRANPSNHLEDDPRNKLVPRSALFVEEFRPAIFVMENARELLNGRFTGHYGELKQRLEKLGYRVHGEIHFLNEFGLPQKRERALIVAVDQYHPLITLSDLWRPYRVVEEATTVRRAIEYLPPIEAGEDNNEDPMHAAPRLTGDVLRRMELTPKDGGSWADLYRIPEGRSVMTPSMLKKADEGDFGSHPDVYGRLAWDAPAPTIKRECAHVGNGRYAHPEEDRLCTVREMALLQGFPLNYTFAARGQANKYRHIGDAVPPLISYQIACVCEWILTAKRPDIRSVVLPNTSLREEDIVERVVHSSFLGGDGTVPQLALGF